MHEQSSGIPLVSVIVPAYNAQLVLARCLDSILAQTESRLEVIVVDDGSTDATAEVLARYAAQDGRVRAVYAENAGVSAARNRAIALARGEYIAFADSDDWLEPDALAFLIELIEETGADIAMGQFVTEPGAVGEAVSRQLLTGDEFLMKVFRVRQQRPYYYIWDKLYRRACVPRDCFPVGLRMGEDVEAIVRIGMEAQHVAVTPKVVYHYYQNPQGVCLSGFSRRDLDLEIVHDNIVRFVGERRAQLLPYAQLNQKRLDFTLLCRLILCDDAQTDAEYASWETIWRERLRASCAELLAADIPLGRKILIAALSYLYTPTKLLMRLGIWLLEWVRGVGRSST